MKEQNYSNHRRFVAMFHVVTFPMIILMIVSSAYYTISAASQGASMRLWLFFLIISLALLFVLFFRCIKFPPSPMFKNAPTFLLRNARHAMHDILLLRVHYILDYASPFLRSFSSAIPLQQNILLAYSMFLNCGFGLNRKKKK